MDPDQVYWIQVYFKIEGMELLVQKESESASFGAKVVPSLQRVDPSFMKLATGVKVIKLFMDLIYEFS